MTMEELPVLSFRSLAAAMVRLHVAEDQVTTGFGIFSAYFMFQLHIYDSLYSLNKTMPGMILSGIPC